MKILKLTILLLLHVSVFAQEIEIEYPLFQFNVELGSIKNKGYIDSQNEKVIEFKEIPREANKIKYSEDYFEIGNHIALHRHSRKTDDKGNNINPLHIRKIGFINIKLDTILRPETFWNKHLWGHYYLSSNQNTCGKERIYSYQIISTVDSIQLLDQCLKIKEMKEGITFLKDKNQNTFVSTLDSNFLHSPKDHKLWGVNTNNSYTKLSSNGKSIIAKVIERKKTKSNDEFVNNLISQATQDDSTKFMLDPHNKTVKIYSNSNKQELISTLTNTLLVQREIVVEKDSSNLYECVGEDNSVFLKNSQDQIVELNSDYKYKGYYGENSDTSYFTIQNSNNKIGLIDENKNLVLKPKCNSLKKVKVLNTDCIWCKMDNKEATFISFPSLGLRLNLNGNYRFINQLYVTDNENSIDKETIYNKTKLLFNLNKKSYKLNWLYNDYYQLIINDNLEGKKLNLEFIFESSGKVHLPNEYMYILKKINL